MFLSCLIGVRLLNRGFLWRLSWALLDHHWVLVSFSLKLNLDNVFRMPFIHWGFFSSVSGISCMDEWCYLIGVVREIDFPVCFSSLVCLSYGSISGGTSIRRGLEFGRTYVVKPKGKHQATIVWLHGLGDNGSRWYDNSIYFSWIHITEFVHGFVLGILLVCRPFFPNKIFNCFHHLESSELKGRWHKFWLLFLYLFLHV